jgi:hypothetical protein
VHTGQTDVSYKCMAWQPDPDGVNGVYLSESTGEGREGPLLHLQGLCTLWASRAPFRGRARLPLWPPLPTTAPAPPSKPDRASHLHPATPR